MNAGCVSSATSWRWCTTWVLAGKVEGTVWPCANAPAVVGQLPERLHTFWQSHPEAEMALKELRIWRSKRPWFVEGKTAQQSF